MSRAQNRQAPCHDTWQGGGIMLQHVAKKSSN